MNLKPGLYDQLVDELLKTHLGALPAQRLCADVSTVDPGELPDRLREVLGEWVREALAAVPESERHHAAFDLSRAVHDAIIEFQAEALETGRMIPPSGLGGYSKVQRLTAVEPLAPTDEPIHITRPLTPLRDTVLMTNSRGQPSVGKEIQTEVQSADRIDLILAFIRWSGIRDLKPHFKRHVESGRRLRVITTTYTGTTERRALQELVDIGGEVKVSYDTSTTRLHAKAWLFQRNTGFSTVYIGSSNLTHSAQVTGLEWNVRASQRRNPELIAAFQRTFETYWEDAHFEPFDPERFASATLASQGISPILTPFQIEPYPFQRQILERLRVNRRRGHPHNLIVAATGTGKTVLAALDYRHLRKQLAKASLLFVAHRREILQQSLTTFRHVLRQGAFGELWTGSSRPTRWDHVFASIQSITARDARSLDPERFSVVIVDEFHHAAAASYRALLDHLRPKHLLGLTATPERADGLNVKRWFGDRISAELRLWDALEQGLLSPFHYFGSHDGTDLRKVTWRRGRGYDTDELTKVYTTDDIWAAKVIRAVHEYIGDPGRMRALGFCVSIAHADFMAKCFQRAGLSATAVTSQTSLQHRQQALNDLEDGNVQVLFTVDLFNEGVDLPTVDVVLMLRPTESATVFLQQLGRGLRRAPDKSVLTVLDFVGHQAKGFRFDERFRRMLGRSRRELESDIKQGFPYLPAGCSIELDPIASGIILENIRGALPTEWRQRLKELRSLGDVGLAEFLAETGLDITDMYRGGRTWTELRRAAGIDTSLSNSDEQRVGKGIGRILHIDDKVRIEIYRKLLSAEKPPAAEALNDHNRRQFEALLLTVLNPHKGQYTTLDQASAALWQFDSLRREILELLPLLQDQIVHMQEPLRLRGGEVPLQVHAHYTLQEILAGLGASTITNPLRIQAGVYWHMPTSTDLCFITLKKSESHYSPTTRYLDYAISDQLFHWETQATVSANSQRGQNYIHHQRRGRNVVLFIRENRTREGRTAPYFCAGEAHYVRHRSERPMQITWRLRRPLPGEMFASYRAAIA
ncbi:MAG: DUF3427 domain-containing protein [Acidimicrobiia bacterium]|nr:DUF3427 domain-containing protein [Acidimicrobiia bacterium]